MRINWPKCIFVAAAVLSFMIFQNFQVLASHIKDHGKKFDYEHPENWSQNFTECGGKLQSPIDVDLQKARKVKYRPLVFVNYNETPTSMSIENNGHSAQLTARYADGKDPTFSGGPLNDDYVFVQLHFHWSRKDKTGSEHTLDGKSYSLEMHMVHYKKEYGGMAEAANHTDGLSVIGFFADVEQTKVSNTGLDVLQESLSKIVEPKTRTDVKPLPLSHLIGQFTTATGQNSKNTYITYKGSLTTPPCTEAVNWILSLERMNVSTATITAFRKLHLTHNDDHNYRPVQVLNTRTIEIFSA